MTADHRLPVWAPRVPQRKIRRLYATDAAGIYDAYGPESTPGLTAKKARWDEQITHARSWRRQDPSEGK